MSSWRLGGQTESAKKWMYPADQESVDEAKATGAWDERLSDGR